MRLVLEPDMLVVGEADDGTTALALATSLQPAVVLIDIETPGLEAVADLQANFPCHLVIIGLRHTPQIRDWTQKLGAAAFVEMQESPEMLLSTLRQVTGNQ
jgi:DNA-binding NarL/FixJ family response regulator